MSRILYVSSSPRGSASYSNQIAARVIRELQQVNPQATVTVRDLAQDPLPTSMSISLLRLETPVAQARTNNALSLRNRMLWSTSCSPLTSSSSRRQ
jgi:FMN-dependent NADH-azoreductase